MVDHLKSEFHASQMSESQFQTQCEDFHKTVIDQIETTMGSFEKRLFPYRRQRRDDSPSNTAATQTHPEGIRGTPSPPKPRRPHSPKAYSSKAYSARFVRREDADAREGTGANATLLPSETNLEGEAPREENPRAVGPAIAVARATRTPRDSGRPASAISRHR